MDTGPRQRWVQKTLQEILSRIRCFIDLPANAFDEAIRDLPDALRSYAERIENPSETDGSKEMPGLKGYALWAENYDSNAENPVIGGEEEVIGEIIGSVEGLRVLDAGCGTGRHAILLAEQGAKVVGIEPSEGMIAIARQKARERESEVEFLNGSIDEIDSRLGAFDLVLCCLVLSHVEDLDSAIGRLSARLKPGGRLIVSDFHPINLLLGYRTAFVSDDRRYVVPNFLHQPSDYFRALTAHRLVVEDFRESGSIPSLPGVPMTLVMSARRL